jgi:poly [ADP-ribose] polymerase
MAKPTIKEADLNIKIVDSVKQWMLNFTDIQENRNKYYSCEVIKASDGNWYLYTSYGRVGAPNPAKEFRKCSDQYDAENEADKIIKSKIKKGYVEVKMAQVSVGSEVAKSKINSSVLSETEAKKMGFTVKDESNSSLHPEIQKLVKSWFGSIDQFVMDTLDASKCSLGTLSLSQINVGRDLLLDCRKLVAAGAQDITTLNQLSSKYYSNIPMNFGYRRLDADALRFDNDDKLDKAFDILDTLEGAKDAEKVLTHKSNVDEKYLSLKTEMQYLDPKDPMYRWIDSLFHKTRASNHRGLGKLRVSNIFRLVRPKEYEDYLGTVDKIAKNNASLEVPDNYKAVWSNRPTESKDYEKLMQSANILPLWHGSRTPNFPKILSSRLMMRKPGFTVAGSMFDKNGGLYFASNASKSIGYSSLSNSVWSGGSDETAYLFLSDVCLGKPKIAHQAHPYTLDKIKPCNSVWAKAGQALYNDEYIVYTEQQNWLRYVVEFENI